VSSSVFSLKVYARFIPMAIVMGMIFYLSHQPGNFSCLPKFIGVDKLLHVIAYGSLAATMLYGLDPMTKSSSTALTAVGVVFFCILYGISDEYHQSFIPGRSVSAWDVAADGLGAFLVAAWWMKWSALSRP
jgi:VanZ family protein